MADDYHSEFPYWSIYYDDEGYDIKGNRIMGRQAAGWSFLKALVKDCLLYTSPSPRDQA